jgi:hypothetical protein
MSVISKLLSNIESFTLLEPTLLLPTELNRDIADRIQTTVTNLSGIFEIGGLVDEATNNYTEKEAHVMLTDLFDTDFYDPVLASIKVVCTEQLSRITKGSFNVDSRRAAMKYRHSEFVG